MNAINDELAKRGQSKYILSDTNEYRCVTHQYVIIERGQRFRCYVNPYGGKKKAPKVCNLIRPLFEAAGCTLTVISKLIPSVMDDGY